MGRKKGSKNVPKQPKPIALSDQEKLSLIADLLLELVVDEIAKERMQPCQTV